MADRGRRAELSRATGAVPLSALQRAVTPRVPPPNTMRGLVLSSRASLRRKVKDKLRHLGFTTSTHAKSGFSGK